MTPTLVKPLGKRQAKAQRVKRIRAFLNHLALSPIRFARVWHLCQFCCNPIREHEEFRDGGMHRRAHESCFQAVAKEFSR